MQNAALHNNIAKNDRGRAGLISTASTGNTERGSFAHNSTALRIWPPTKTGDALPSIQIKKPGPDTPQIQARHRDSGCDSVKSENLNQD